MLQKRRGSPLSRDRESGRCRADRLFVRTSLRTASSFASLALTDEYGVLIVSAYLMRTYAIDCSSMSITVLANHWNHILRLDHDYKNCYMRTYVQRLYDE